MAVSDTTAGVGERIYREKISAGTAERSQLKHPFCGHHRCHSQPLDFLARNGVLRESGGRTGGIDSQQGERQHQRGALDLRR